ncbi:general stress protein [Candidatus Woesebacteria bacterium]|nr:general stress protein [Candidatus Woesebacteria bacterium]MCD8507774.1 general stress protein [Candidatus Woesebacteria bacterium]MCD8526961.1 general stress protein [Candidatus Woesebacteria bacterium]MCD8545868.1 general stress protein [Candidatus Woesebacteria bacterium]
MANNNSNRGLASASEDTKQRVAEAGGNAPHEKRGLEAADQETRERVAEAGGEASHGGGRNS